MAMKSCPEIKAIVLYGSYARGDSDSKSDLDICIFTQEQAVVSVIQLASILPVPESCHLSLTTYCQADLEAMLEYGSLFLWHLKLEGKIEYGKEYLASQLTRLKPFERHHSEIGYHSEILDDLIAFTSTSYTANEFDLSLLFTIVRNTCMILAHKAGSPTFGRQDCYHAALKMFPDLPLEEETYLMLSEWKAVYERAAAIKGPLPAAEEMQSLLTHVQTLLEYAYANTH